MKWSTVPSKTSDEYKAYENAEYHVYRRRWYMLALYSIYCLVQCMVWNTFGPIAFATKFAYDWSNETVALILNWGCIFFIICLFPISYFLEWKGLRNTLLLVSALTMIGTILRTVSRDPTVFTVMAHIGAILNGISGITVMSAPPALAAAWFPEKERIFATSIAQSLNIMGSGVSYLVGPLVVPFDDSESGSNTTDPAAIDQTRRDIQNYMIADAVLSSILFILFLVYFPARPAKSPCASSAVTRVDFVKGWKDLLGNRNAWLVCLTYSIPGSVQASWQSLMGLNFEHLDVTAAEIGNIGFVSILVQCCAAICVGYAQDRFRDKIKFSLVFLFSLSTVCFVWLGLICFEVIPFSLAQLYVATIIGVSAFYCCIPLCFELAVMIAFPTPEGLVGAYMTGVYNVIGVVFLLVFFIDGIGTLWMNYVIVICTFLSVPLVLVTKKPHDFVEKPAKSKI